MTPTGFTTVSPVRGQGRLRDLDAVVARLVPEPRSIPAQVVVSEAVDMLQIALVNLEFDDHVEGRGYKAAMLTSLQWLANANGHAQSVYVIAAEDRRVSRFRGARLSKSPTTKQQHDFAAQVARTAPVLYLMRQTGSEARGWRGLEFWWPVVQVPDRAAPALYAVN